MCTHTISAPENSGSHTICSEIVLTLRICSEILVSCEQIVRKLFCEHSQTYYWVLQYWGEEAGVLAKVLGSQVKVLES